jgi:hypothetical protein
VLLNSISVVHEEIICQYSDLGRRSFYKKFGWLFNYEQDIDTYTEIFTQIHSVQKQLKTQGLHSPISRRIVENYLC